MELHWSNNWWGFHNESPRLSSGRDGSFYGISSDVSFRAPAVAVAVVASQEHCGWGGQVTGDR